MVEYIPQQTAAVGTWREGARMRRVVLASCFMCISALAALATSADDSTGGDIPAPLAPFEHLVGAWKGMGIPAANRLKGWPEKHLWAWKFEKGTPVGLALSMEGDKTLTKGQLTFDPATKKYRLEGTDAAGKPVVFTGSLDESGRALQLDREGPGAEAAHERLTIRLNSNQIRYTIWLDRKDAGAPQFARAVEINLGKEGESFAAGGSAADLPKCIITGGAATLSVSYEGKSYPLCCTGCRDEFMENPAKYVKKALLREQNKGKVKTATATSRVGKDDGAFDGLVDEPKTPTAATTKAAAKKAAEPSTATTASSKPAAKADTETEPAAKKSAPAPSSATRAASMLRSAESLEKLGNTKAALDYYKQIVAKHPGTPQAKTAAERIKALAK